MAIETTYTHLRNNLAATLDKVVDDQDVLIVRRRGGKDVALIPAAELAGLVETAHLCARRRTHDGCSPPSGGRRHGRGSRNQSRSLRREMGLETAR